MDPTIGGPHSGSESVLPRAAATVVLLRDAGDDMQVLLTVRPEGMRFMGGAVVFPGGAVADADRDPRWEAASARSPGDAAGALDEGDASAALGAFVCAIRETFEEVGLLLARGPAGGVQQRDASEPATFLERCLDAGVVLATDELVAAGRWITPPGAPARFDTRFFVTTAPPGWEPAPDPAEVAGCRWMTPSEALEELARGRVVMAPPTIDMLQRLQRHRRADDAIAAIENERLDAKTILRARLAPSVVVVLAPNPGLMTGPGTNTYVVGREATCVIDPAVDDRRYMDALCDAAGRVDSILITHRHADHVGGIRSLVERTGAVVWAFGQDTAGGVPVEPLGDGDVVDVGDVSLRALHAPGHARDHLCFFDERSSSLFSGDNILGEGTSVIAPPEGDMRTYVESLRRLSSLAIERIYPGHFRALNDGGAVIERYIAHRAERERAIVEALGERPSTLEEIVARVYADTPNELHPVARYSALAHLEALRAERRVVRSDDLWSVPATSGGR